jgi:hypothetical protein
VDPRSSLRYADDVQITSWLHGASSPTSELWFRTPHGYEQPHRRSTGSFQVDRGTPSDFFQGQQWGATAHELDAVNDSADRRAAIEHLLDTPNPFDTSSHLGVVGTYGTTEASNREDARIARAIKLLGAAPLSPEVRHDLFDWLAGRPIAKLGGDATDHLGRRGTLVTFERVWDKHVPAHLVTIDQLRDEFAHQNGRGISDGDVRGPKSVLVKADHQYRRWYASIIVDRATGELLEYSMYGRIESTAQHPRLQQNTVRPSDGSPMAALRVAMGVDRLGTFDAKLYGVRERTTSIAHPLTAACAITPRMCR